ncbi:MAG: BON domain-containing protein [Bacteriovorax sp.]
MNKLSDEVIKEEVWATLMSDKDIDTSDIQVEVRNGTVILSGTVPSRDDKLAAEISIEDVAGVEDIQNDIQLRRWEDHAKLL